MSLLQNNNAGLSRRYCDEPALSLKRFYGDVRHDCLLVLRVHPIPSSILTGPGIHCPGLALAGFTSQFPRECLQLIGDTEFAYLRSLPVARRRKAFSRFLSEGVPAIVFARPAEPEEWMISAATKKKVAVFSTKLSADVFRERASAYLGSVFAERTSVHGTLVLVHGVGVLYVGKSGTGKSECALDLITRGHTLVSDDVVHLTRARGRLIGECNEILGHHMEIRGVGIVNIKELCGLRSVRSRSRVDVQVELIEWNSEEQSGRNGWADATVSLLGVSIPRIKLPVSPGKNISAISEILALRIKSSRNGKSSIKQFEKKLILQMHNSPRPSGTSCVEHTGPAASRKDAE